MAKKPTNADGWALVVKTYGGPTKMAQAMGVTRPLIYHWKKIGIPPNYWPAIHKATGLKARQIAPEFVVE